jgi:hypothetical protein
MESKQSIAGKIEQSWAIWRKGTIAPRHFDHLEQEGGKGKGGATWGRWWVRFSSKQAGQREGEREANEKGEERAEEEG